MKNKRLTTEQLATLQLFFGALLISFAAVFVRLLEVPPTTSAFYRTLVGGVVLLCAALVRRESLRVGSNVAWILLVAGLLFALDLAFWHRSIIYLGPGLSTLLANFQVFVLAIAGVVLFKEKLRAELVIGITLAMVGLGMIVGVDWSALTENFRAGIIFGLLTALCYGGYVLALRRARVDAGPRESTTVVDVALASIASTGFLFLIAMATGESLSIPNLGEAGLLLAYGLVTQVFGWLLISSSLAGLPASRVGLVLLTQPTFAYVWDVLFFAKPVGMTEAGGAGLALLAIYLGSRSRRAKI